VRGIEPPSPAWEAGALRLDGDVSRHAFLTPCRILEPSREKHSVSRDREEKPHRSPLYGVLRSVNPQPGPHRRAPHYGR
jgi:hypothetical protein